MRYTARQASEKLRVSRHAVSMWKTKGWLDSEGNRRHLTVVGHDCCGAAQFDWSELTLAERDTRRKTNRSHRRVRI